MVILAVIAALLLFIFNSKNPQSVCWIVIAYMGPSIKVESYLFQKTADGDILLNSLLVVNAFQRNNSSITSLLPTSVKQWQKNILTQCKSRLNQLKTLVKSLKVYKIGNISRVPRTFKVKFTIGFLYSKSLFNLEFSQNKKVLTRGSKLES